MKNITRVVLSIISGLLALSTVHVGAGDSTSARPKLQIINGSDQTCDIFWLKSTTERVPNGAVKPGSDNIITTTLGHRFEIVGRTDKASVTVTSEVPVQAIRFDPKGRDGVPPFYMQRINANGFPIVASARVNPYALQEAAFLVNMMLAKRTDAAAGAGLAFQPVDS